MENNIQIFKDERFGEIRVAGTSEKPWFCLTDVCKALGLRASDVKGQLSGRGVVLINTPTLNQHGTTVMQELLYVNEPGLYRCIMRSRKAEAEAFQDWVFEEVLPTIRKKGSYSVTPYPPVRYPLSESQSMMVEWAKAVRAITDGITDFGRFEFLDYLQAVNRPATFYTMAQDYGMTVTEFNDRCVACGMMTRTKAEDGGCRLPFHDEVLKRGYVQPRTLKEQVFFGKAENPRWVFSSNYEFTPKGRVLVYVKFSNMGIQPVLERNLEKMNEELKPFLLED